MLELCSLVCLRQSTMMAAGWLLHALYSSLLSTLPGNTNNTGSKNSTRDVYLLASTSSGIVRGKVDMAPIVPVAKFLGIPFATPPSGPFRFQPPQPPVFWSGVRDALHHRSSCVQTPSLFGPYTSDEDCLYLNVYVPTQNATGGQQDDSKAFPVMVWIHGGGYVTGGAEGFDGTALATKGVVIVTINYRLGVFGFLSTDDETLPGNYGLLDQIASLKWIKQNIAAFGGDPNLVTLFGESAGSSSVSVLVLSPLATGLFHRVIMESGSALSPFGVQHLGNRASSGTVTRLLAARVGCDLSRDKHALVACLRAVDAHALQNVSVAILRALDANFILCPRVESVFGVLPDSPRNLLHSGRFNNVDTIIGFNSHETSTILGNLPHETATPKTIESILEYWLKQMPELNRRKLVAFIKAHYNIHLDGIRSNISSADLQAMKQSAMKSQDDLMFIGPALIEIDRHAHHASGHTHFLYQFSHRSGFTFTPSWVGAGHAEEFNFIFGFQPPDNWASQNVTFDDHHVAHHMMTMWTNFAKSGDPSMGEISWRQYTTVTPNFLDIDVHSELKQWFSRAAVALYSEVVAAMDGAGGVTL